MRGLRPPTTFMLIVLLLSQWPHTSSSNQVSREGPLQYPDLRRDDSVVDDYYGTKVGDPYRYLEDPDSEETKSFVKKQNEITEGYLARSSVKKEIEEKLMKVSNYPKHGIPKKCGDRYYSARNTGLQNQDVYYVQDSLKGKSQVFFDPNTLSEDGTVHLNGLDFTEDGQLAVLSLTSKGSDWTKVKIRNVSSGEEFPETLEHLKFSNIAWTKDNLGFFYARFPTLEGHFTGTETTKETNHKLYYHRIGTDQKEDVLVVEFEDPQLLLGYFGITEDGKNLLVFPTKSGDDDMLFFANIEGTISQKLEMVPIVPDSKHTYAYVTSEGSVVYLQTNEGAPNSQIVAVDLYKPDRKNWKTLVPENKRHVLLWAFNVDTDKLVLNYLVDVKSQLEIRSLSDGSFIQKIKIPLGTVDSFGGEKKHTEIFFRVVSFLTPAVIYHVDFSKGGPYKAKVYKKVKVPGFHPSRFITKQVFYSSKDGTKIPMFIVHKRGLQRNGNASTLIYSYGGFGVSLLPSFQISKIVFLENFGGVYAVPNIRGGGEYGQKWHEAGSLLNKQNAFDDFQAAAEYLVREKYTSPSKIAINGASNGGLLVAACVNQRPELYRAAIADVGVHDLLRFQKFTIGYAWCSEFGCSDDGNETTFDNLYRLSPLHNVRLSKDPSVQYPAVLLTTGDHDDRVVPLHSYKFIAELQYKIGTSSRQTNPLLIKIETSAGHGGGKPLKKGIAEVAEMYAFMVESAGFVYTP